MTDSITDCSTLRRFSRPARTPAWAWSMARATRPAVQMFCDRLTPTLPELLSDERVVIWVSGMPSLLVSTNCVTGGKSLRV